MGVLVVGERQPGRRFGRPRGRDLQVKVLHPAVRQAGRDLEAVAPSLSRAGSEEVVAAAADVKQGRNFFFFFAAEGGRAGSKERTAYARPLVWLARLIR